MGSLDGSIVAQAVLAFMRDRDEVVEPPSKLHGMIQEEVGEALNLQGDREWPKTGRNLYRRLREVKPLLAGRGIYVGRESKSDRRIVLTTDPDNVDNVDNVDNPRPLSTSETPLGKPNAPNTVDNVDNYGLRPYSLSHALEEESDKGGVRGLAPDLSTLGGRDPYPANSTELADTERRALEALKALGTVAYPAWKAAAMEHMTLAEWHTAFSTLAASGRVKEAGDTYTAD